MKCRFCNTRLEHIFIDLINSPASNSFLTQEQLNEPETFYPLKVYVCHHCFLVQIDEYKKSGSIFNSDYVYFSSYSKSWLAHAKNYANKMIARFGLTDKSQVIEIASNDGYLLQYFKELNIPVLGIEPTANTAVIAQQKGIHSIVEFFNTELAKKLIAEQQQADLLLGNNVLAHVPDIVDFIRGMKILLRKTGVITMEFPHLMQLVDNNQFDTIYHEHYSYLSFSTVKQIFESSGLELFDVEELSTHGGSIRIYAQHQGGIQSVSEHVSLLLEKEMGKRMNTLDYYKGFETKALEAKMELTEFLIRSKRNGKKTVAYGAAAKGNTLLNYCGIKKDLIDYVVDANPFKQNKWLPASHIPVMDENQLKMDQPDHVLILPWNLKEEIMEQLSYIKDWDGRFIVPIPSLNII